MYAAHSNTPGIRRIIQRSNQHLRCTLQLFGGRNILQDTVQKRINVISRLLPVGTHPIILGRTVDNGEIQLVLGCIQAEHQVEHHLVHFFGTAIWLIHLIHNNDRFQTNLQSFLQYKPCLRHRTFESIHKQNASIRHIQYTFHFTSEVTVSRSINNVNLGVFVVDRNVL